MIREEAQPEHSTRDKELAGAANTHPACCYMLFSSFLLSLSRTHNCCCRSRPPLSSSSSSLSSSSSSPMHHTWLPTFPSHHHLTSPSFIHYIPPCYYIFPSSFLPSTSPLPPSFLASFSPLLLVHFTQQQHPLLQRQVEGRGT